MRESSSLSPTLADLAQVVGPITVTYSAEFIAGEIVQARQDALAPIAAIEDALRALDRVSHPPEGAR